VLRQVEGLRLSLATGCPERILKERNRLRRPKLWTMRRGRQRPQTASPPAASVVLRAGWLTQIPEMVWENQHAAEAIASPNCADR
jgi:hypothetical protein